jgi:hypothetical protein
LQDKFGPEGFESLEGIDSGFWQQNLGESGWGIDLNVHPRDLRNLPSLIKEILSLKDELLSPYLAAG